MHGDQQSLIHVGVFDYEGNYVENAAVRLEPEQVPGETHSLQWDRSRGCYIASAVAAGRYRLIAGAPSYETSQRNVEVEPDGLRTIILLGRTGLPFLFRGQVRTPFAPQPDLFVIALDDNGPDDAAIKAIAAGAGIHSENWNGPPPRHARVFRFSPGTAPIARAQVERRFADLPGVYPLGPVVHFDRKESISCLTDELVIRFHKEVTRAQIEDLARRHGLTENREMAVAENLFVFQMPGPLSYGMLDLANELAGCGLVVYAEPNLVSIGALDAIGSTETGGASEPTDFLFPMQWHLPLIGCPRAWRTIHQRIAPARAMGSPDITIAVVDWGIDVDNPEFAGRCSDGQPKLSAAFDFHNMVCGNDARFHGHGTCCAGVATALPNNGGGCGVAGNCRLVAVRRPEGIMATETAYSDMYLWVAGLDARSPTPNFPQRLARGADVISNSFGYAAGLPISGLMQDTFDLLTEYGRDGRGVLLFFSTGNSDPPVDFTLLRPWAAHARTLAISASTLAPGGMAETRARQSNFGGVAVLDLCAPSASALGADDDRPRSYAVIAAADRAANDRDPNLQPNTPSEPEFQTATTSEAPAGAQALDVVTPSSFLEQTFVLIGIPGSWSAEFNRIRCISQGGTRFELEKPLQNSHPAGTIVCSGPAYSTHKFSGTSCATAIAAGTGALLLSARPELSWGDVRDILRGTAVKIDAANADATGIWRDANGRLFGCAGCGGPHYSRGYGFGRIDAAAAVEAAISSRGPLVSARDPPASPDAGPRQSMLASARNR